MEYVKKLYHKKIVYEDCTGGPPLVVEPRPVQNIVQRLKSRELFNNVTKIGTEKYLERSMCQSIFPNFTVTNVEKPSCFIRKFTPNGKYLIAFSWDYVSVDIYKFNGPQSALSLFKQEYELCEQRSQAATKSASSTASEVSAVPEPEQEEVPFNERDRAPAETDEDFLEDGPPPARRRRLDTRHKPIFRWTTQIGPEHTDDASEHIRNHLFGTVFTLKFRIRVAKPGEQLNRECSLFTEDSRYLIVASATYIHDEHHHPTFHEMHQNNESVEPNSKYPLEDYTIHIVDLKYGALKDSIEFPVDKIYLSHNQGIYLYNQTLAILSVQHQTIHIYHITDGEFRHLRSIGRFCHEDDSLVLHSFLTSPDRAFEDTNYNVLKHRLLGYLYRRARRDVDENGDPAKLRQFHRHFLQLEGMRIWKMQLLDEDTLLLKYSAPDVVTLKVSEPNSQYCLFVFYCISTTEILGVHDSTSEELVDLFEAFTDNFRNNFLTHEARYCSSPANNRFAMESHQNFRQTITSARFGGPAEATKRILTNLPISAQSYSSSPYLDQALFSYDDHRVSIMERPKASGELPIRFFGRDSGLFKFEMFAGISPAQRQAHVPAARRLVAFTFHPTSPFAISVQRTNAEYLINFHFHIDMALSN